MTPTERVRKGAKLLDQTVPGWRDRIDIESVQIGECENCVLAQLWSGADIPYFTACAELKLHSRRSRVAHGFLGAQQASKEYYKSCDELTECWRSELDNETGT